MKLLIASDLHGDAECTARLLDTFHKERCEKMLLLGDLLYHGPRNDLPRGYAPKKVIEMLNEYKDRIIAVRGNCDTEVDQMVLKFPILADYAYLMLDGICAIAHHGHHFDNANPPPMNTGELLICGHTHVQRISEMDNGCTYLNPGSVSIPKEGNPPTYIIYSDGRFEIKTFDGNVLNSLEV